MRIFRYFNNEEIYLDVLSISAVTEHDNRRNHCFVRVNSEMILIRQPLNEVVEVIEEAQAIVNIPATFINDSLAAHDATPTLVNENSNANN